MKDMFYNYDNNIDKLEPNFNPNYCELPVKPASSSPDIKILRNKLGKDIGIQVKYQAAFDLYFYLDTEIGENKTVYNDLAGSIISFKIMSNTHQEVLAKSFYFDEIFNHDASEIVIPVTQEESLVLQRDTYRLKVTVYRGEEVYELFDEPDGLLLVR